VKIRGADGLTTALKEFARSPRFELVTTRSTDQAAGDRSTGMGSDVQELPSISAHHGFVLAADLSRNLEAAIIATIILARRSSWSAVKVWLSGFGHGVGHESRSTRLVSLPAVACSSRMPEARAAPGVTMIATASVAALQTRVRAGRHAERAAAPLCRVQSPGAVSRNSLRQNRRVGKR